MHVGHDAWRAFGRRLFRRFRAPALLGLGALSGVAAGIVVTAMSALTNRLHSLSSPSTSTPA